MVQLKVKTDVLVIGGGGRDCRQLLPQQTVAHRLFL